MCVCVHVCTAILIQSCRLHACGCMCMSLTGNLFSAIVLLAHTQDGQLILQKADIG